MADEMQIILPEDEPGTRNPQRREIAQILMNRGNYELYAESMGKKMSYKEYLSIMCWDILTLGEFHFADGRKIEIQNPKEWLEILKWLVNHLDGPVPAQSVRAENGNVAQVNVFKVYVGVDPDKV